MSLGIATNMADVTANYVDVRLDRKFIVLETYQNAMFPKEAEKIDYKIVQQEAGQGKVRQIPRQYAVVTYFLIFPPLFLYGIVPT